MARRRFQKPKPVRRGQWWTLLLWKDCFVGTECKRKRYRVRLAPATMSEREVLKLAEEHLRPLNQGLESIGSATNFRQYVETTFLPVVMPLMAKSTQDRSRGVLDNYLCPTFGKLCLRDLTALTIQRYFSEMASSKLAHESRDKIRDVLSSVLRSAVHYGLLVRNPVENVRMPAERSGRKTNKPYLTPGNSISYCRTSQSPTPRWSMWRFTRAYVSANWLDCDGTTCMKTQSRLTSGIAVAIGALRKANATNATIGSKPMRCRANPPPETSDRRSQGGQRSPQVQSREVGRPR